MKREGSKPNAMDEGEHIHPQVLDTHRCEDSLGMFAAFATNHSCKFKTPESSEWQAQQLDSLL